MTKKRKKRATTSIPSGDIRWLSGYIAKNSLQKSRVAEEIGIPKSTFSDILNGKSSRTSKENKKKISNFIKEKRRKDVAEVDGKVLGIVFDDIPTVASTKRRAIRPVIPERMLNLLLAEFAGGADMAVSAMTVIVNAGFPERKLFREILGEKLEKLRRLSRALSSEPQLQDVLRELGQEILP